MPEVSVIIPNYNHAEYLDQRIQSVLKQTFRDIEIILLDDCSTDRSRDILERYRSEPQVKEIVYNEKNSGSGFRQWRKGIAKASGKYIWIAESDDFNEPDFLGTMIDTFRKNEQITIAFCHTQMVDPQGQPTKSYEFDFGAEVNSTRDWVMNGAAFCRGILCKYNILLNASSIVFSREAYNASGGVNTDYRICSDWLLWWEIVRLGDVAFIAQTLNYYRIHPQNTSFNWREELAPSYRFFLSHWPPGVSKDEFFRHIADFSIALRKEGREALAREITRIPGRIFQIKAWLRYRLK